MRDSNQPQFGPVESLEVRRLFAGVDLNPFLGREAFGQVAEVEGTSGADDIRVALDAGGDSVIVTINGDRQDPIDLDDLRITVRGGDGNDDLVLDESNGALGVLTILEGGAGDDTLTGGDGYDVLRGEDGDDVLNGGDGLNHLNGGDGDDTFNGGAGNDLIFAGSGDDIVNTLGGSDVVRGGTGQDTVNTGDGADFVYGSADDDVIDAGPGDNWIEGGRGDDRITAGDGDDTIYGSAGTDDIRPGGGDNDVVDDDESFFPRLRRLFRRFRLGLDLD